MKGPPIPWKLADGEQLVFQGHAAVVADHTPIPMDVWVTDRRFVGSGFGAVLAGALGKGLAELGEPSQVLVDIANRKLVHVPRFQIAHLSADAENEVIIHLDTQEGSRIDLVVLLDRDALVAALGGFR